MIHGKTLPELAAKIVAGQHELIAGVLPKLGGKDEGPDPHQLLESALAACTIITVQMYANRRQMKLRSTNVEVKVESESKEASVITRKVSFEGELTEEERAKLLEIANKCPIHKLLSSQITVKTERA